jgi:DNA polymerase
MIPVIKHPIPQDINFRDWMLSMPIVTVDLETYWDDNYTLSKMTMLEYVQDPRFKAQGMSIRIDYPAENRYGEQKYYRDMNEAVAVLNALDKWVMVGQNTKFDGYCLHYHYDVHATAYACTRSMSKGLWPFESASLKNIAVRLWPDNPVMRKGDELASSKGVRDWSEELHKSVGDIYCNQDVYLTAEAFWKMLDDYPTEELEIIHITTRMLCIPTVRTDHALLQEAINDDKKDRALMLEKTLKAINQAIADKGLDYWNPDEKEAKKKKPIDKMVLSSRNRYIRLLREIFDVEIPMKEKVRPNGSTYQTEALAKNDPECIKLQEENPDLAWLFEARDMFASSQSMSRAQRMIDVSKEEKGNEIPIPLNYYEAHTGRYTGGEKINMQNLGRGSKHRLALLAPPGFVMHVADSSNVEARTNAGFAGQEELLEAFRNKRDVYSEFASKAFDMPVNKKENPTERGAGKVCVLGLGYQMGAPTLRRTFASGPMGMEPTNFPLDMCKQMVNIYLYDNYMIAQSWKDAQRYLELMSVMPANEVYEWNCLMIFKDKIRLPNGMHLNYPKLHFSSEYDSFVYWNGKFWKRIYGGALIENIIQALARIIVMHQCIRIDRLLQQYGGWIVMQVHDENIGIARDLGEVENDRLFKEINQLMCVSPTWMPELPLDSEGGWAENYSK